MVVKAFPPLDQADEYGMLAVGGDLEVESLLLAYRSCIYPWPISPGHPLAWFSPDPRGILFFDNLHISKSLSKFLKETKWEFKINTNFPEVIQRCAFADNRKDQDGTWITPHIIKSYIDFHRAGYAFSAETYEGNDLIGGLYGVKIGNYVAGESMFYLKSNASKYAFAHLAQYLQAQGVKWLDTQMVTPVTEAFGAEEVPREAFIKLHGKEVNKPGFNFP